MIDDKKVNSCPYTSFFFFSGLETVSSRGIDKFVREAVILAIQKILGGFTACKHLNDTAHIVS